MLSLQQSAFACFHNILDGETSSDSTMHSRIISSLDPFFSLLLSSVSAEHCHLIHSVAANFIRLLSRLISCADVDFTIKVFSLYMVKSEH